MVVQLFFFTPIPGEMIQFDEHIFQMEMGWNHQLVISSNWIVTQLVSSFEGIIDHSFLIPKHMQNLLLKQENFDKHSSWVREYPKDVLLFSVVNRHSPTSTSFGTPKITTRTSSSWWLHFLIFTFTSRDDPIWGAYFSNGLVQPPLSLQRWIFPKKKSTP